MPGVIVREMAADTDKYLPLMPQNSPQHPQPPLSGSPPPPSQQQVRPPLLPLVGPGVHTPHQWRPINHYEFGQREHPPPARQMGHPTFTSLNTYNPFDNLPRFPSTYLPDTHSVPGLSQHVPPSPIARRLEPHTIPLPTTSDANLTHGPTIAQSIGHSPAMKIAGSRWAGVALGSKADKPAPTQSKAKGKRKREDLSDDSDLSLSDSGSDGPTPRGHGGRRPGAGNYGKQEIKKLLDLVERELPIGQRGWKKIQKVYVKWAVEHKFSLRDAKSLEQKFKNLAKMKKPTGNAKRPPEVTRAKSLDKLINESSGTRNVNDSEFEDSDDHDDRAGDHIAGSHIDTTHSKVITVTARSDRSEAPQVRRTRGGQTTELVHKIAHALDPEAQRARDDDRSNRSLQNTQIFTLTQQLRDSQNTIETLRSENNNLRDRINKLERMRDRLDLKLNFERRVAALLPHDSGKASADQSSSYRGHKRNPDLVRVRGKIRQDTFFPEGGQETTWITDGSSASDFDGDNQEYPSLATSHNRSHPYPLAQRSSPTSTIALHVRKPMSCPSPSLSHPKVEDVPATPIPSKVPNSGDNKENLNPTTNRFHPQHLVQHSSPSTYHASLQTVCKPQHRKFESGGRSLSRKPTLKVEDTPAAQGSAIPEEPSMEV